MAVGIIDLNPQSGVAFRLPSVPIALFAIYVFFLYDERKIATLSNSYSIADFVLYLKNIGCGSAKSKENETN